MRLAPLLSLLLAASSATAQSVRIQVVDVGQGDGMLVRTPHHRWVLIDAGENRILAESLGSQFGVDRLALVVVSHRHGDHYGGLPAVLRKYRVDRFVGNLADCPNRTTDNTIRQILADSNVARQSVGADTITIDGVDFIILPPDPVNDTCPSDENDNSVMVRLEYGQFSMLFTGDGEAEERDWLVANHAGLLDVDVLKASHHGSNNGTSSAWLQAVSPAAVVISAGVDASYGHPMAGAVAAYDSATGGRVHCTNRHSTLTVYGYQDGGFRVRRKLANSKSCAYDGTHY